jgi:hypothetical protein
MQALAHKLNTTFVVHSLNTFKQDDHDFIGAWVIPPQGEIIFKGCTEDQKTDRGQ